MTQPTIAAMHLWRGSAGPYGDATLADALYRVGSRMGAVCVVTTPLDRTG